jgi:rhamnosyltransferase
VKGHPIGAAVIIFHPDPSIADRLAIMRAEADEFVVVVNGANDDMRQELERWCESYRAQLVLNDINEGLGAALNRGAQAVRARGAQWLLAFDQDSTPGPGMVDAMLDALRSSEGKERVAILGPAVRDNDGVYHRWLRSHPWLPGAFRKERITSSGAYPVTMVISSGSLIRLDAWQELGGFDENLFIDGVDTDFCLRAKSAGWQVVAAPEAVLHHRLGSRAQTGIPGPLGRPTHHSALRHYYIARNRVILVRRHALRAAHWAVFEICMLAVWLVRVIAFESSRRRKLHAMFLGTWDGFRGGFGPCPPKRIRQIATV